MVDEMNTMPEEALQPSAADMSKQERKAAYTEQNRKIAGLRKGVEKQLSYYKKAAVRLDKSYDKHERAQAALALKPNKAKHTLFIVFF